MVLISVEGLIGAGKSLFLTKLKEHKNVVSFEPVNDWIVPSKNGPKNILTEFYKNPRKYACMFQTFVLRTRVEQAKNVTHGFVERCIHSDKLFAAVQEIEGNMDENEMPVYEYQFKQAIKDTPPIHGHIYLKTSVSTCIERIEKRGRKGESVSRDYLEMLEHQHDKWLNKDEANVLIIDGEVDLNDKDIFADILKQVNTFVLKICKLNKS